MRTCLWALLSVLALLPAAAGAQGFGLDLTQEGPELRPNLAFFGLNADPEQLDQAARLASTVQGLARGGARFARVVSPDEVRALLDEEYAEAMACAAPACLAALAHQLGVHRILTGKVDALGLHLLGFDWGAQTQEKAQVPAKLLSGAGVDRRMAPQLETLFHRLAAPLGQLEVTVDEEAEEIRWGGRLIGSGKEAKAVVPGGTQPLRVQAAGFLVWEEPVEVPTAGAASQQVSLEREPLAQVRVTQGPIIDLDSRPAPAPPAALWEHPGFYAAAVGAAVLGAGLLLGANASAVSSRAKDADGDGVLDITRANALSARRNATYANVLGGVGAAGLGAGVTWIFLNPLPKQAQGVATGPGSRVGVSVHGSF